MKTNQTRLSLLCAALIAGAAHGAGAPLTEVTIPGGQILMPESLTSAADGTVIIGSIAGQKIFKANPGSAIAELWISPGASIFGVFADDKSGTLWACSGSMGGPRPADAPPPPPSALHAYDLKTGADKGSWNLPTAGGFCNDIAVDAAGNAYITDTNNMDVNVLKKGATALEVWAGNGAFGPKGGVLDGIAIIGDKVYVNALAASKLFVTTIDKKGKAGPVSEVKLNRVIERPDGQRAWGNKLLVVEGGGKGRLSKVEFSADGLSGTSTILNEGYPDGPVAVTVVGDNAYVLEGQFAAARAPVAPGAAPAAAKPYKASAVKVGTP